MRRTTAPVLLAWDLANGPVAVVHLPIRIPTQIHGSRVA